VKALLCHFHRTYDFCFSSISPEELPRVQKASASRHYEILPTGLLTSGNLSRLLEVLQEYHPSKFEMA
jgi:hypothetical protein